jgi:tetratricopeptide (TPR) repeat protein
MTTETGVRSTRDLEAVYERASGDARRAAEAGDFEHALACFDRASDAACALGDGSRADLVLAKRASILIEEGRGLGEIPRLRELLVRNVDSAVCRFAAYNLARWYELQKEFAKALFYARVARDHASLAEVEEWRAASHNQVGNVLLAQSKVAEASAEYEQALTLMPAAPTPARARVLDNLGYCRVLAGRLRDGFSLLYSSLRILRRAGAERYTISTLLDLSYAHLEARRYSEARRYGQAALDLARRHADDEAVKNAYFLLGEAASLSSQPDVAQDYFTRLQREFFPTQSYLPGFLLAVDVRKLVNLHA